MEEKYPSPKMNLRQWLANFWYYNKWYTLLGLVFLSLILISLVQCSSNSVPDASVLYVGPRSISNKSADEIREGISELMHEDYNGNGKKSVSLKTITLVSNYDELNSENSASDSQHDAFIDYNNEILAGDSCILLLDPYFYEELCADGSLMTLFEALGDWPEEAEDFYGVRLSELDLYSLPGFSSLPGDTVICFKYIGSFSEKDDEKREAREEQNRKVFADLLEFTADH